MDDKLYTKAYVEKADGEEIVAVASTNVEDRQGEIISNDGWDLKNFKAAPRLLWAHDHKELPIGKVDKIWIEKNKAGESKLMFKPTFQTVTEKGKALKELVKQGFLNTFSVGFKPIDSVHDEDAKSGTRYTKQELLEISLVNVPANPQALTLAYKSLKDQGFDNETITEAGIPAAIVDRLSEMEQEVKETKKLAEDAVKGLQYLNPHTSRKRIAEERATWLKVIDRSADKILEESNSAEKKVDPMTAKRAKVIKQAGEKLILSNKGDLHGSIKDTSRKTS